MSQMNFKIKLGEGKVAVGGGTYPDGKVFLSFSELPLPYDIGEDVMNVFDKDGSRVRILVHNIECLEVIEHAVATARELLEQMEEDSTDRVTDITTELPDEEPFGN